MPYEVVTFDPEVVAAAARGEDTSTWTRTEARWLMMRTPIERSHQVQFWIAWVVLCVLSVAFALFIIGLVCFKKRLRSQPYNHYIIGLTLPDLVFSALCGVTCSLNAVHGHFYDGDIGGGRGWMCDFQSFYCTFGIAGSLWVNVLVTHELRRLTSAMRAMVDFTPVTTRGVYARLCGAYALSLFISWVINYAYLVAPSIVARPYPQRDLACLPTPYSAESEVFFFLFTLNFMLFTPLLLILVRSFAIYQDFRAFDDFPVLSGDLQLVSRRPLWPPSAVRSAWSSAAVHPRASAGLARPSASSRKSSGDALSGTYLMGGGARKATGDHTSGLHGMEAMVNNRSQRLIVTFFSRLLVVLFVLWLPFFVLWVVCVPYHIAGGWFTFICGSYAHLQGIVSALAYAQKPDIKAEIFSMFGGTSDASTRDDSDDVDGDGADVLVRSSCDSDAGGPGTPPIVASESVGSVGRSAIISSSASGTLPAPADGTLSINEEAAIRALSDEAKEHILALSRTPMLVVAWDEWLSAGTIPRSDAGNTRQVEPEDIVIFISHRWWDADNGQPDDVYDTKYLLICKGVRQIMAAHALPSSRIAIWIDFSSIDQLDAHNMALGISSLISYAARSAYVLIPVEPSSEATYALTKATHPIELLNFGDRAWCRLETYVFVCLSEVMQRAAIVYAYSDLTIRAGRQPRRLPRTMSLRQHVQIMGNSVANGARSSVSSRASASPAYSDRYGQTRSGNIFASVLTIAESKMHALDERERIESAWEEPPAGAQPCAPGRIAGDTLESIIERAGEQAAGSVVVVASRATSAAPGEAQGMPHFWSVPGSKAATSDRVSPISTARSSANAHAHSTAEITKAALPPPLAQSPSPSARQRFPRNVSLVARATGFVLRARLSAPREVFRPLLTTTLGKQSSRQQSIARFSRLELPSSGKLTVESDRAVIEAIERSVRDRFVQHAILSEKMRRSLRRALRRKCVLDYKQLEGPHLHFLSASLHADPAQLGELCSLSLRGNLFLGEEIAPLVQSIVCSPSARSLTELHLGHNAHLGISGMQHIAAGLASPACRLRKLHLDHCALRPNAGRALAEGLRRSSTLHYLNLMDNRLDNGAVMALIEARETAHVRHGVSAFLHVERNAISPAVYKLVVMSSATGNVIVG